MKTLKTLSILLICCILYACPDKPDQADHTYNAIEKTFNTDLNKGLNTILKSNSGKIELKLKIVPGKKPEYLITENGTIIPSKLKKQTVSKATTCWRCAYDGNGDMHCFIIACPKDLDPIGTVLAPNFRLAR